MISWLPAGDDYRFPDPGAALREPDGLLAAGGDLSPGRLLAAYRRGIFPWYEEGQPILWWSPDPRAVLFPDELHVSRSLKRTLRRAGFTASVDTSFDQVLAGCAERTDVRVGTWITREMAHAYARLHALGHAHSVEIWQDDRLVGGLYGLALGRIFFGESMFSRASDASKVALVHLVNLLTSRDFVAIDCQLRTAHLESLGARGIPRPDFLDLLQRHLGDAPEGEPWAHPRREVVIPVADG